MAVTIQIRRDTAANWTSANPTLALGEIGLETDTKTFKVGDGTTVWNSLGYFNVAAAAPVSSVFGRTGAVVAAGGDYTASQVGASLSAVLAVGASAGAAITNLTNPTNAQDAATKAYVDAVAQGLSIKQSCRLATAAALPAVTLVGSTLVAVSIGVLTIDGQAVALNDRILVKDQVAGAQNGIYTCTTAGTSLVAFVLTRATDSDTSAEIVGGFTFIEEGTANAAAGFVNTNSGTITVGTTAITYTQFSGAGEITAGAALTKTGNTLDVAVDGSTLEVSSDALRVKDAGVTSAKLASGASASNVGSVGGDLTGTLPNPTLANAGPGATGPLGSATVAPIVTIDAKGRVTALSSAAITADYAPGGTDVAVADGGTGASSAATARTNLGIPAAVGGTEWTVVTKAIDESTASDSTVNADAALFFTAANGVSYEIELDIVYASPAGAGTPDIKFVGGEDTTIRGAFSGVGLATTDAVTFFSFLSQTTATAAAAGTAATNRAFKLFGTHTGAGGTWTFYWAQNTSGINATIVRAGSILRYRVIV